MTIERDPAVMKKYLSQLQQEETFPEKIFHLIELRRYEPGEYLCRAGEQVDYFWLVLEGRCKVQPASEYGKTVVLSYIGPLGLNGDIELFNDCPFLYSVQAENKVVTITIPRHVFLVEMMENLAFLRLLCRRFASKIYYSSQKHSSAMLYPIKSRLARYMIMQSESVGGTTIILRIDETAQYLGITARHLRRVLTDFESMGLIHRAENKIAILDIEKMKTYASYQG